MAPKKNWPFVWPTPAHFWPFLKILWRADFDFLYLYYINIFVTMDNFFSLDACPGPSHVTSFSLHRPSKILFSVVKTSIYRCICTQICINHICKTLFVTEAINSEDCTNADSHAVDIEVIFFLQLRQFVTQQVCRKPITSLEGEIITLKKQKVFPPPTCGSSVCQ